MPHQNEDFLRTVLESLDYPFYVLDAGSYAVLLANHAAVPQPGEGNPTCYAATHRRDTPCSGDEHPCPLQEVIRTRRPAVVEHTHCDEDGRRRVVEFHAHPILDADGNVVRMVEYTLDVTARREAEDLLRELSLAVEQSPSTVVITDIEGDIEYANPKFVQLTGYGREEVRGENPRLLKAGLHPPEFYTELWRTILAGQEWRGEFANRRKDGTFYWEQASISPIRDAAGAITHFVKVAEDITARKQAEEALRQRTAELQERNAELDAFAHTVAHDLKNPLATVIGFAELLEQYSSSLAPEQSQEYIHRIVRGGRLMDNIVRELLLLASVRRAEVQLLPLDMERIVPEARSRLAGMVEEYQAEVIVPESWPLAIGYAPWVEEVWVNYLSNALKYGGRPPRLELGAQHRAEWVHFWLRDNGPGLGPEEQERLFAPFTRLGQVRVEGHGLGLSIVRHIVEKLGGRVDVRSELGHGSTFGFTLPAAEAGGS